MWAVGRVESFEEVSLDVKGHAILCDHSLFVAVAHDGDDAHIAFLVLKIPREFVYDFGCFLESEIVVIVCLKLEVKVVVKVNRSA